MSSASWMKRHSSPLILNGLTDGFLACIATVQQKYPSLQMFALSRMVVSVLSHGPSRVERLTPASIGAQEPAGISLVRISPDNADDLGPLPSPHRRNLSEPQEPQPM